MNGIQTWPIRRFLLLFSCVLFLCSVFSCGKALAFSVTEKSGYVEATTGVNVRSGPGKEYNTLGSLKEGEQIPMTGLTDNGWYEIKFKGQAGYVYSSYVTELEDADAPETDTKESQAAETAASASSENAQEEEGTIPSLTIPVLNVTIPGLTRTLLFVLAGIVIVLIIILSTIVSFRKGDDDEEDEDEEDEETEKDEDRVLEVYRPTRKRSSSTEELSREELEAALTAANQKIASLQREIEYLKRTRR